MVLGSAYYQTNGATTTTTTAAAAAAAAAFRSDVVAAVAARARRRTPSRRGRRRAAEPSSQSKTEKDDDAVTLKCVILPGFLRGFESYEELRENVEKVMEESKETVKKKEGSGNAGVAIEVSVMEDNRE